jgi:hypothetical protein
MKVVVIFLKKLGITLALFPLAFLVVALDGEPNFKFLYYLWFKPEKYKEEMANLKSSFQDWRKAKYKFEIKPGFYVVLSIGLVALAICIYLSLKH